MVFVCVDERESERNKNRSGALSMTSLICSLLQNL